MDNPQTLAAITSALAQTYPDEVKRQVNRMSVLLALLTVTVGAGKNVPWDVEADGMVVENFSEGAAVANFGSDALTPATLNWGLERANFRVTNLAAAAAATSQSPAAIKDLLGRNMFNACGKLASTINGLCYTGAGTGTLIAGSAVGIKDDNTYAGLDRTAGGGVTNAFWKSYIIDPGVATTLTFKQIRTDLAAIYKLSGRRPDVAFVSPDVMTVVKGLFDPGRQWMAQVVTAGRGLVTLESTANVVIVDGCQFVEDKDAPAGSIEYWNTNEVELQVLPQAMNFADPMGAADDGFNKLMLGFSAYELGRVGSDRRMSCEAQMQLKIMRPNAFGRRLNVAT